MKNENDGDEMEAALCVYIQNVDGVPAPLVALQLAMLNDAANKPLLKFIVMQGPNGAEIHGVIPETMLLLAAQSAPSAKGAAQAAAKPAPETNRMPAFGNN